MKKSIVALFVFMLTATFASAQANPRCNQRGTNKNCTDYVDANKDGICDKAATNTCNYKGQGRNCNARQKNCNGQGNRNGTGRGKNCRQGRNFTDANNNGVCDTFEKQQK